METPDTEPQGTVADTELVAKRRDSAKAAKRSRIVLAILGVTLIGIETFQFWQLHKLQQDLAGMQWTNAIQERNDDSVVTPEVGTIQFLRKGGYSIHLETVKYTGDGLYLQGFVGNPLNLWLTNVSLKFTATKQLYQYQDDFRKDHWAMIFGPTPIGEAQCSPIPSLSPGSRRPFEITVPNVKQTKEGVRLVVAFTGERYSYTP
jgi:hypothetical protein